ncbi:MAG: YveK family protein [Culicoidibacterales bacterium]
METTETTIDLKDIAYILKKHLKMLIALPVAAALLAGVVSFFLMTPIYQASANILVNRPANEVTSSVNPTDITAYQKLVSTYAELAKLDIVYQEAGKQIGLDEKATKELAETISVSPKGDTQILTISVQSEEPELAQQYVSALTQALKVTGAEKLGQDNIQLLDAPVLPENPVAPNKVMNVAIAFVLGGMIAVFVAFLIEYLDTRVKRPEEIEQATGLPIIGMIPLLEEGERA